MNAVVDNKHMMQVIDWSRFDLEGWLYQFGAWMFTSSKASGKNINPIAVAIDSAVKAQNYKKLSKFQKEQFIIDYLTCDFMQPKSRRSKTNCLIDDNEARAVQRLILDMQGQSEVMDGWLDAIIFRYFYNNSWSEMKSLNRTEIDARMDVKCGLAALHARYNFIVLHR